LDLPIWTSAQTELETMFFVIPKCRELYAFCAPVNLVPIHRRYQQASFYFTGGRTVGGAGMPHRDSMTSGSNQGTTIHSRLWTA
jgi:hypothetical protein